jgi:GDP-4-dehydro-6-deoxy-D-mannose reductase
VAGSPRTALVTGGPGFVGRPRGELLTAQGWAVNAPAHAALDLLDAQATVEALEAAAPDAVFHLAAGASVARSWEKPGAVIRHNFEMTLNVLEAARAVRPSAVVVLASSSEVYGPPATLPVVESAPLRPQSPYAASKAASDLLGGQYADGWDMRVVRARAFNHAGPDQPDGYVIGALTRQVAEGERDGLPRIVLRTGNPHSRRDFSDVRDVVRAYELATALPAGAYNVASGNSRSVAEIIEALRRLADRPIEHEIDPARLRPNDVPDVRGSSDLLRQLTGWEPVISFEETVRDALNAWRAKLGAPVASRQS